MATAILNRMVLLAKCYHLAWCYNLQRAEFWTAVMNFGETSICKQPMAQYTAVCRTVVMHWAGMGSSSVVKNENIVLFLCHKTLQGYLLMTTVLQTAEGDIDWLVISCCGFQYVIIDSYSWSFLIYKAHTWSLIQLSLYYIPYMNIPYMTYIWREFSLAVAWPSPFGGHLYWR